MEEKRGQPWKQVGAAELPIGDGVITIASLPTSQHQQLKNREPGPSNACRPELQSRTPPRVPLYVPDAPIYRVGPQLGAPLYVPDAPNNREGPQAREPSN